MSRYRSQNRLRGWMERILLLAGIAGIGIWMASRAVSAVSQDWDGWVLDRAIHGETGSVAEYLMEKEDHAVRDMKGWLGIAPTAQSETKLEKPPSVNPPVVEMNGLIGRLTIPRLHLTAIVRQGTSSKILTLAAGHIPGTALPGEKGNVAVAGHRDTLFRGLRDIQPHDVIQFETLQGNFEYEVASTEIVTPQDVGVLKPGRDPELTLVTCYPFNYIGSAPDRFIVKARQVLETPSQPEVWKEVSRTAQVPPRKTDSKRVSFSISPHHSRELVPGIMLGVTEADPAGRRVDGWMWLMPDRRTIWLRDQEAQDPLVFYGGKDGKRHEVVVTNVSENSVTGYLLLPN